MSLLRNIEKKMGNKEKQNEGEEQLIFRSVLQHQRVRRRGAYDRRGKSAGESLYTRSYNSVVHSQLDVIKAMEKRFSFDAKPNQCKKPSKKKHFSH
jgi:hypothetical protein